MCDPLTIAGIALTAGSTVMNSIAQGKVQKARDDALGAERIRQGALDQEAAALNTGSQDRYQGFEGKRAVKSKELGDYFAGQSIEADKAAQAAQDQATPPSSSNITVQEEAKQRAKADAFTDKTGMALGNLRSFGDLLGGISRDQARDATSIGQIGGFKRGSSGVVPYELDQASHAGDSMKMFGDILNLGGGLAMNSGLSGGSLFGGGNVVKSIPKATVDPWVGMRSAPRSVGQLGLAGLYGGPR